MPEATVKINAECPFCNETTPIEVKAADFQKWRGGMLVQNAFPYLDAAKREMLVSGMCGKCWEETFAPMEDEEE